MLNSAKTGEPRPLRLTKPHFEASVSVVLNLEESLSLSPDKAEENKHCQALYLLVEVARIKKEVVQEHSGKQDKGHRCEQGRLEGLPVHKRE